MDGWLLTGLPGALDDWLPILDKQPLKLKSYLSYVGLLICYFVDFETLYVCFSIGAQMSVHH